jgi:hypothetical protein
MSRGNGWPHARAMGDGSVSADLLPEEEVDEDLSDDVLVLEHPTAFGVSHVLMLRRFVFAAAIDHGARHARSASVGAACLGPWDGHPVSPMDRPTPLALWKSHPKIYPTRNPKGCPTEKAPYAIPMRGIRLPSRRVPGLSSVRSAGPVSRNGANSKIQSGSASVPLLTNFRVTTFAVMSSPKMA